MEIPLALRPLEPVDLPELAWTGGQEHLSAITSDIGRALAGEIVQLVAGLPSGRLVAFGAVDLTREPGAGRLWMLSVRKSWQSLGVGRALIGALEQQAAERGAVRATIAVEHDNPRARALYLRLGYRPYATELDRWAVGGGRRYVTVTAVLAKDLVRAG